MRVRQKGLKEKCSTACAKALNQGKACQRPGPK